MLPHYMSLSHTYEYLTTTKQKPRVSQHVLRGHESMLYKQQVAGDCSPLLCDNQHVCSFSYVQPQRRGGPM